MYLLETQEAKKYNIQEPGFTVEIELAAQSASLEGLTEVPISYRPRIGKAKLSTRDGLSIMRAAIELARRYNPILLYSGIASLSIIPAFIHIGVGGLSEVDNSRLAFRLGTCRHNVCFWWQFRRSLWRAYQY